MNMKKKRKRSLVLSSGERIRNAQLKRLAFLHHFCDEVTAAQHLDLSVATFRVHMVKMRKEFNNFELVKNYCNGKTPSFTPLGERLVKFYHDVKEVYDKYELPYHQMEIYEVLTILYVYRSGSFFKCEIEHGLADGLASKRVRRYERKIKSKIIANGYFTNFGLKICSCGLELELLILDLEIDIEEIKNKI